MCFRFQICENWRICLNSEQIAPLSQVDLDYDRHLQRSKAQLKENQELANDGTHGFRNQSKKVKDPLSFVKFEDSAEAIAHRETAKRKRKQRGDTSHHYQHHAYAEEEEEEESGVGGENMREGGKGHFSSYLKGHGGGSEGSGGGSGERHPVKRKTKHGHSIHSHQSNHGQHST